MAWQGFDPTIYNRDEYRAHVEALPHLPWVKFLVLHNTGRPTLKEWVGLGVSQAQRIINLEHYYEVVERWHAGPHAFVSRNNICGFSDPTKPGVHASCWNHESIGVECAIDASIEDWNSGDGSMVRDNAVYMFAVWHGKLGLDPATIVPHKGCIADHHDCPGHSVDLPTFRSAVRSQMAVLGYALGAPHPHQAPVVSVPRPISTYLRKGSKGDRVKTVQILLGIPADGDFGDKTVSAVEAFQSSHGLAPDGIVGPVTMDALKAPSQTGKPA